MDSKVLLRACPWMLEARRLIGTREVKGPAHNAAIIRMWHSIRAPFLDDETPWCAGYVGHCLEAAGIRSTRSPAARSYATYGWPDDLGDAKYGAIVVLSRPGSAWSGHVAFLTGMDPVANVVHILGGNQDNQVQYAEYPAARVVAVRSPPGWTFAPLPCPPFTAKGRRARSDA